jgi:two-component system phosphate regulon sensor histidine kinase PhoR
MMPEISVAKMLQTLCDEAKAISGDKHHKIVLNIDKKLILRGYPNELKSLFSNLIINAIKYTPEKGEIRIQWFKEGDEAVFQVVDAGIGIDKAEIPRLTERFYRVDKARSREDGGTGLGLAIVKHVLMRHGGELQITSQLGKGSTFRCVFTQSSHKRKLPVQCGE